MNTTHSITVLIQQLRASGDAEHNRAAHDLWRRYVSKLIGLARRHLAQRVRQREDEEDVVQRVYDSFCRRQRAGEYQLDDREDLWRLLVVIVQHKAANVATYHNRGRRNQRREKAEPSGADAPSLLDEVAKAEPTPDEAVALVDELQHLLARLDPPLQQLVLWKLEGYTNEEAAAKMDCAVRSVERKLARARKILDPQRSGAA